MKWSWNDFFWGIGISIAVILIRELLMDDRYSDASHWTLNEFFVVMAIAIGVGVVAGLIRRFLRSSRSKSTITPR